MKNYKIILCPIIFVSISQLLHAEATVPSFISEKNNLADKEPELFEKMKARMIELDGEVTTTNDHRVFLK